MVSIAAFGPIDLGSNPSWFAVSNLNKKWVINAVILQAYDRATPIVIKVTVSSLVGGDK